MFLFGYSPHKNGKLDWLDDLIFLPLRIGIRSEDLQDFFEKSVKGSSIALSSPRLVIPAAIYGLWELSQHFAHDLFDFQVMLCTFTAFELTLIYTFNLESWQLCDPLFDSSDYGCSSVNVTYVWDLNSWFLPWLGCLYIKQLAWCKSTEIMKTFNFFFLGMKKGPVTEYLEYVTCWCDGKVGCLPDYTFWVMTLSKAFSHLKGFVDTKNHQLRTSLLSINDPYEVLENWPPWTFQWMQLRIILKEVGNIP